MYEYYIDDIVKSLFDPHLPIHVPLHMILKYLKKDGMLSECLVSRGIYQNYGDPLLFCRSYKMYLLKNHDEPL
jgi:hypothetical protein